MILLMPDVLLSGSCLIAHFTFQQVWFQILLAPMFLCMVTVALTYSPSVYSFHLFFMSCWSRISFPSWSFMAAWQAEKGFFIFFKMANNSLV
ncbi:hypothetical protein GDO78_017295 [Eleutherodactylus coqui]|uniref:Uncharacterized protein n=1 Tax=Eleutherodactylus coqui TaxID=57060 RepID=A0A8J6B4M6_ELECQ|nr:hypothetical protein GDO78_017295 [Eleutherodactylus coqui]